LNIFQKFQINEENKLFNEGKATFYEELNENSDLPKDVFEKEKEGDINLSPRFFGDLDIDKSKWFTHPQLERLYGLVNRQSLPDNYDSRSLLISTQELYLYYIEILLKFSPTLTQCTSIFRLGYISQKSIELWLLCGLCHHRCQ